MGRHKSLSDRGYLVPEWGENLPCLVEETWFLCWRRFCLIRKTQSLSDERPWLVQGEETL